MLRNPEKNPYLPISLLLEVFVKILQSFILFSFVLCLIYGQEAVAVPLKIGVVDLNRALNESEEGIRSRNILESEGRQMQQELKLEEEDLREQALALRNNVLLKPEAKKEKEAALKKREQELVQKSRTFEQTIRKKERQITSEIFKELKAVIRTVARKEAFDLILEKNAAEVILYMNNDPTDLTVKVIDHYNSLKTPNN